MRLSRRPYMLFLVAGIVATVSVVVYASISQTFPSVTVPSLVFATKQNCSALNFQNNPAAISGTMIANCGSGTSALAAFSVNRDGTSTPTFTITHDAGILTVSLGIAADGSGCGSTITPLTSGAAVSFGGPGAYIYCLQYTAANTGGNINAFGVTWSP